MPGIFARKDGRESRFAKLSFLSASGEAGNPFKSTDDENRIAPRREVSIGALIVHTDFSRVLACQVDDVSQSGARLRAPECFVLPREFWLVAQQAGLAYKAVRVWRRFPHAGLSLGAAVNLNTPTNDVERGLQAVWLSATQ
jgi:hypothetical protein